MRWLGGLVILAGLGLLLQGVWWGSEENVETAEDSLVQLSQEAALEPVLVTAVEPEEERYFTAKTPVVIHFSEAMVFDDTSSILQRDPELQGRYVIKDDQTFEFFAQDPVLGQAYHFQIPAGLEAKNGAKLSEAYDFTLYAGVEGVLSSYPLPGGMISPEETLAIQFSQPVDLSGVRPGVNVQLYPSNDVDGMAGDGFFNTEVRYGNDRLGNEQRDMLFFKPSFPFQSGQTYRLILRAGESFSLEENFVLTFTAA